MPAIKTFGEKELFTKKQLKHLEKTTSTKKYIIPLEITIYGDVLIHHFWTRGLNDVKPKYLIDTINYDKKKFHINKSMFIECGNCLQDCILAFDMSMTNESRELFNNIMCNIVKFTKTSHYPALGIVEIPEKSTYIDVKDVSGCKMILNSVVKITNIICGFDNDEKFFRNFEFTGYDQDNIEHIPQVVKFDLNHNAY